MIEFWVMPWRLIGAVLFNFVLIFWLIAYVIRLRRRIRQLAAATEK